MGVTKTILTAEQFDEYPFEEDKRYELDEGEYHRDDQARLPAQSRSDSVDGQGSQLLRIYRVRGSLELRNLYALAPSIRRAPDLAIFLGDRSKELADSKVISIIPDIAAEVLSPSETPRMINRKLKQYFAAGVKEVWLIHPEAREIEICTGTGVPETLAAGEVLTSRLLPAFELPLNELFA